MSNEDKPAPRVSRGYRVWFLALLVAIYACSFIDRVIVSIVGQSIKLDLKLSDFQFGLLGGMAFALFYAAFGIPIARLAERRSRVNIIASCIALWSVMTALTGLAQSYLQLLLLRMGVGLGEGGCSPAAHSLISDMYPARQRSSAIAVYSVGVPLGSMIGAVAGGWLAQTFSWRTAFVVVGLPGLVLAILARLTLREPERGPVANVPPLAAVLARLLKTSTFRHMAAGCILTNIAASSINLFTPPYLMRSFGLGQAAVGLLYGLVIGSAGTAGYLVGGFGSDFGARKDLRWYAWAPAIGSALACPIFLIAFTRGSAVATAVGYFFGAIVLATYFAPTFAVVQNLVDLRMRASASALMFLAINLFGQGLGPTVMGLFSDAMAQGLFAHGSFLAACPGGAAPKGSAADLAAACGHASAVGLQRAILASAVFFAWGALHYFVAARTIRRDMGPRANAADAAAGA